MLRLDVNVGETHAVGYQVPGSNPFVTGGAVAARPEIWAFGLRNPWRYSFDDPARGGTGALVVGDVGQGAFEEIDYEPPSRRAQLRMGPAGRHHCHTRHRPERPRAPTRISAVDESVVRLRADDRPHGDGWLRLQGS
jgi:hypothetical protein